MDFSSSTSLRYSITCSGAEFMISKHVTRTIDCIFAMETKSVRSASSASTAGSMWRVEFRPRSAARERSRVNVNNFSKKLTQPHN